MEYLRLGGSDIKVSVIGLGAWQWGSSSWGYGKGYGKEEIIKAVRKAHELGINFIDTAEIYGDGLSERIVGEAIKGYEGEFVIATKVAPWHLWPSSLKKAARRSLERLGLHTLDLYQIHMPNPLVPLGYSLKAMEELVEEGKIRLIGVSNFSASKVSKCLRLLKRNQLASDQVLYNMIQRDMGDSLLTLSKERGFTIIAYSPLAQGLLSGKYDPSNRPQDIVRLVNPLFTSSMLKRTARLVNALREVGRARSRSPTQVALNWLIAKGGIVAIPGVKNEEQVEENAKAADWRLSQEEARKIEEALEGLKVTPLAYPQLLLRLLSLGRLG